MKKAVIYARVSTEGQEEQKTIESQLAELRLFAKNNQYEVVNEYIDNGWSGGSLARPELDRLRDDIKNGCNFEFVLIHHPDRLARKYISQGLVLDELKKKNIEVVFLNRPNATNTLEDNLLLGVEGLFAEYEKEKILERTRRGRLHKARNGFIITGIAPFGYDYVKRFDKKEGYLKINKKESEIVTLIFDLFTVNLLSVRALNKELLKRNISPRGGAKTWAQSTLHRILRNETYIGTAYYNKHYSLESPNQEKKYRRNIKSNNKLRDRSEWIPIKVIPIVNKEVFNRAQDLLKQNGKSFNRQSKFNYLLSGLIKCENCGSTYSGENCHGSLFYRCNNRHKTFPMPKECNQQMISTPKLETVVFDAVKQQILNPRIISRHIEVLLSNTNQKKGNILKSIKDKQQELNDIKIKREKILDLYSDSLITKDDFAVKRMDLDKKENEINNKLVELNALLANIENKPQIKKSIEYFCNLANKKIEKFNFEDKKTFLKHLIDELIFSGDKIVIKGVFPILNLENKALIKQESGILSPLLF